jgi:fumarate reductase subunit C
MEMQDFFANPVVIAINIISLFFVVFHAITWFNLAPKAMAVRLGGKRVPAILIAGPQYVAWLIVSGVIAWLLLRG